MDNLPNCAWPIIAVAVGLMPGLALLLVGPIVRLLYRCLPPRPDVAHGPIHRERPSLAAPRG
jgi:hypothetical protein